MTRLNYLFSKIFSRLNELGFKAQLVSSEHLYELKNEIKSKYSQGLFDKKFYSELLGWFDFTLPPVFPEDCSIIIITAPQPVLQVTFRCSGGSYDAMVPPTYNYDTDKQTENLISELLKSEGYQLIRGTLPEKLLATRCGLAKYGKNNITYVEGMGSYHRPVVFYTDAPVFEEHWEEPQILDLCQKCDACTVKCPTGAISTDRFLLYAEKCLTYHNESSETFPQWVDSSWHNCLIGCMICQNVCPVNKPFDQNIVHVATFSEQETNLILKNTSRDNLPRKTLEKLDNMKINMLKDFKLISRNLKVLLENQK